MRCKGKELARAIKFIAGFPRKEPKGRREMIIEEFRAIDEAPCAGSFTLDETLLFVF